MRLHNIEIDLGCYTGIVKENRLCKLCNQNVIENEYRCIILSYVVVNIENLE